MAPISGLDAKFSLYPMQSVNTDSKKVSYALQPGTVAEQGNGSKVYGPSEQTVQPQFGIYTMPGVTGVERVNPRPVYGTTTSESGEKIVTGNQGEGLGKMMAEGTVGAKGGHHNVNETYYDPLYKHSNVTFWAAA